MDLPTYTNIWRIEKRLYKLYDFRLPAPLPITWIGVFVGITVPYVLFLIAVGLPFNHTLVWLYVLPPGVLTWLTTRPVIENKRLPELVSSQLRYVAEPRTWCRMAPFAEKDEILVTARVWHHHPPKAGPKKTKRLTAKARSAAPVRRLRRRRLRRSRPRLCRIRSSAGRSPFRSHRCRRWPRRPPRHRHPGRPHHLRLHMFRSPNGLRLAGPRNAPSRIRMPSPHGPRGPANLNSTPRRPGPTPGQRPNLASVPRG